MRQNHSVVFLCTGEGEHTPELDTSYLCASPSWAAVEAAVAELCHLEKLPLFFSQVLGEHGHPLSPVATTAINILNADLWRSWGFVPDFALGHSIGEVAAAYIAGVLTLREALSAAHQLGDAGSVLSGGMLHTVIPRSHLELRDETERRDGSCVHLLGASIATPNSLSIAAINCEESCGGKERCGGERCEKCGVSVALSGPMPHVDAWLLRDARAKRLKPERPWHHPAYQSTAGCAMVTGSSSLGWTDGGRKGAQGGGGGGSGGGGGGGGGSGGVTFVSATTGTDLTRFDDGHWGDWLTRPVQFSAAVRHMARLAQRRGTVAVSGPPTLVTIEMGCHPVLSGLTSTVLAADGARVLAQAASMRRGFGAGFAEQERARLQKQLDGR